MTENTASASCLAPEAEVALVDGSRSSQQEGNAEGNNANRCNTFTKTIWALRLAVFAEAVDAQLLGPNYALLVMKNGAAESFETTEPFSFATASYFIPMALNIGIVLSGLLFGRLSDKIGRRPCMLICCYMTAVGSVLKYWARQDYWLFCATCFASGLFHGSAPVAIALASDLSNDRQQTDAEIGTLVAINMIGRTGGGLISIAMKSVGLFAPLWAGSMVNLIAGVICQIWMVVPNKKKEQQHTASTTHVATKQEAVANNGAVSSDAPTHLDKKSLTTVVLGSLTDNLGSLGLVPFCLNPLLFETFYANFVKVGVEPLMNATSYKFIYVCIALAVIPGAAVAPTLFKKIGPAWSASLANVATGAVTIALLRIASVDATYTTYVLFAVVLYCCFPLTVISQLSTGPLLDRIAPESQRGTIQGINTGTMNIAGALGPFLYGLLTDISSIDTCLYVTTGISFLAAVINGSLVGDSRFGPTIVKDDTTDTDHSEEDVSEEDMSNESSIDCDIEKAITMYSGPDKLDLRGELSC